MPFNDLREFIDAARKLGQVKEIHGAHWNLEIGALTELFAFKEPSPLVLFDRIPDHAPNFRVASNLINTPARSGLTVGMPTDQWSKWGGVPFTTSAVIRSLPEAGVTTGDTLCWCILYYQ